MKDLRYARLLQTAVPDEAPPPAAPVGAGAELEPRRDASELRVALELAPSSTVDLSETADALERWVRQRVVATGQRIELTTMHHAHDGATALGVSVPAAWVIDAKTGRAGLLWSLRGRGLGVKPAQDVLGSVFVTAIGAARLLGEHDGVVVRADELEVELDDRRALSGKKATLVAVVEELGRFLGELFRGRELRVDTEQDHPGAYRVHVHASRDTDLATIIAGLHRLADARPNARGAITG